MSDEVGGKAGAMSTVWLDECVLQGAQRRLTMPSVWGGVQGEICQRIRWRERAEAGRRH